MFFLAHPNGDFTQAPLELLKALDIHLLYEHTLKIQRCTLFSKHHKVLQSYMYVSSNMVIS